jgi:hypothetical protein
MVMMEAAAGAAGERMPAVAAVPVREGIAGRQSA